MSVFDKVKCLKAIVVISLAMFLIEVIHCQLLNPFFIKKVVLFVIIMYFFSSQHKDNVYK